MKSQYVDQPIHLYPKKGLLTIKLPKQVVTDAFRKLSKKGTVVRISHQDESGDTSVLFLKESRKKVEKIVGKLEAQYFEDREKLKKKDKKKEKKKDKKKK